MCDAKPRTCKEWQIVLKGIAYRSEPMSTEVATMARDHAVRCPHCWEAFGIVSAEAKVRGFDPVPPMLRRVVEAIEHRRDLTKAIDLDVN